MAQPQHAEANLYQGATPIGQPQNQSGNPVDPNEGGIPTGRSVAKNFYMGGPIQTMKVEIDDDEYHRYMDSLYFQVDMDLL